MRPAIFAAALLVTSLGSAPAHAQTECDDAQDFCDLAAAQLVEEAPGSTPRWIYVAGGLSLIVAGAALRRGI